MSEPSNTALQHQAHEPIAGLCARLLELTQFEAMCKRALKGRPAGRETALEAAPLVLGSVREMLVDAGKAIANEEARVASLLDANRKLADDLRAARDAALSEGVRSGDSARKLTALDSDYALICNQSYERGRILSAYRRALDEISRLGILGAQRASVIATRALVEGG